VTGARQRVTTWVARTAAARAAYDLLAAVVRGTPLTDAQRAQAAAVPRDVWERLLDIEGCAAWLDHARRRTPRFADIFGPATALIRAEGERALRNAVAMVQQLAAVAPLAASVGARVLVLKGSARLLAGEIAGARTMADIDLFVPGAAGIALHAALQSELGYQVEAPGTPERHLASLVRADSLPIEIHTRLTDAGSALDRRVWDGARTIPLGGASLEIPSATVILLHTLEHGVVVHRAMRYRMRDILDVVSVWGEGVDLDPVEQYVSTHRERRALETVLAAARSIGLSGWPANLGMERRAWRRIGRVGRARLLAPPQPGIPAGMDPRVLALSQIAEGRPGPVLRLVGRGVAAPGRAMRLVMGRWLPVEAARARDAVSAAALASASASAPASSTASSGAASSVSPGTPPGATVPRGRDGGDP